MIQFDTTSKLFRTLIKICSSKFNSAQSRVSKFGSSCNYYIRLLPYLTLHIVEHIFLSAGKFDEPIEKSEKETSLFLIIYTAFT